MDLSAMIFVGLAVAWAVYLIPKAIKLHDEAGRTRSVERFSHSMRVLAHREAVSSRDARLVVAPRRSLGRVIPPAAPVPAGVGVTSVSATTTTTRTTVSVGSVGSVGSVDAVGTDGAAAAAGAGAPGAEHPLFHEVVGNADRRLRERERQVARSAARRRRRVLIGLLLGAVVVAGLAAFALVPWWATAVPGGLVLCWLVVCRLQVRRLEAARAQRLAPAARLADEAAAEPARQPVVADAGADAVPTAGAADVEPTYEAVPAFDAEDTMALDAAVLAADVRGSVSESSLWDPLPLTLPTYVTKPRAHRSVRQIALDAQASGGNQGTWSSGHAAEDSRLVAEQAAGQRPTGAQGADGDQQAAVGS